MRAVCWLFGTLLLAACSAAGPRPAVGAQASSTVPSSGGDGAVDGELRMMTFNIRYGTAQDGENHWRHRKDLVAATISESAPHVLAIQEGLGFQMDYLAAKCPGYQALGQHRNGGKKGEFSGLLVAEARLHVVDWGQFWLSPTPQAVASKGWDAALPRTAVWARLRERCAAGEEDDFIVLGTHFDHRGVLAREESARLIVRRMDEVRRIRRMEGEPSSAGVQGKPLPVVLMGDFNSRPGTVPMAVLEQAGYLNAVPLFHSDSSNGGTFHRFDGYHTGGMIDSIWCSRSWQPSAARILRPRRDGRSASDHYPVYAEWRSAPRVPRDG